MITNDSDAIKYGIEQGKFTHSKHCANSLKKLKRALEELSNNEGVEVDIYKSWINKVDSKPLIKRKPL